MSTQSLDATELLAAYSALAICAAEEAPEDVVACLDATSAFLMDRSHFGNLLVPQPLRY